jgi:hypothetical protein
MHPQNEPQTAPQNPDPKLGQPTPNPVEGAPAPEELKKDKRETDKELDHGLKETFPASDPVSINPGAD